VAAVFTLPHILAGLIVLALTAYVLLAGADFGGGVWDLLALGPRRREQRALIADAIGPIWEANHVWLILIVVMLFTCFPPAFARLAITLHIPLTLMLIGIVLRGSAFTFRTYDSQRDAVQQRWGTAFAIASVVTPVLLGVCVGALASGTLAVPARGFWEAFVAPWLTPFAFTVGMMTLALFAFLAATYLTLEAEGNRPLQEDFRRRALGSAGTVFATALLALLLARRFAPSIGEGLTETPWAVAVHLATGLAAVAAIGALLTRRYRAARVAAAAQASLIVWGWAAAQYPYMIPPRYTITSMAAPTITLRLALIGLAGGTVVLIPSLWYLFHVFKGQGSAFHPLGDEHEH
jgi:cytochrome d ubiquinol oxidase subunit II